MGFRILSYLTVDSSLWMGDNAQTLDAKSSERNIGENPEVLRIAALKMYYSV